MNAQEIIEQIMTQHWDMAACRCWVCEAGRALGHRPNDKYTNWRGRLEYVDVKEPRVSDGVVAAVTRELRLKLEAQP